MKKYLIAACLAATMAAGGCGDDDDVVTNPNPSPSPTAGGGSGTAGACTQTTVSERAEAALGRNAWESMAFTTQSEGRLDITVSWQNGDSNIGAFLVSGGSCSQAQFQGQQCSFILASGDDNPHQMSARVPAGDYELLLQNFGGTQAQSEPVTAKVVLSAGTDCPAFPGPSPSPSPSPTT